MGRPKARRCMCIAVAADFIVELTKIIHLLVNDRQNRHVFLRNIEGHRH